jgi:hypothetical protein
MFYRACFLAVQRDFDESTLRVLLSTPCPDGPPNSRHYCVDLVFQFLPDLYRLARGVAKEDPFLTILEGWAVDWPLSSVGMKLSTAVQVDSLLTDDGLARWYVQRIIAHRDTSRLSHPTVIEGVRTALGLHHELAPDLAACLAGDELRTPALPHDT